MTKNVHVPEAVFESLKAIFDDKQIAEVTVTVAAYNSATRFFVPLDVGDVADQRVPQPKD